MRILYVHPSAWTGEYAILLRLRDLGHEVCVLEESRTLQVSQSLDAYWRTPGDRIRTLWYDPRRGWRRAFTWLADRVFRRAFDGRNLVHRMAVIRMAVRHFSPDVVICSDGFSYGIPAAFLKRVGLLGPRLVLSYIGGDILDCPEADVGKRRTPMVSWLIRQSIRSPDVLRPVSPLLEAILLKEGAAPDRIVVCPSHLVADMADLDAIHAQRNAMRKKIRTRFAIAHQAPLAITLGGNYKAKGLQVLARAWPRVVAAFPDARWLLCGPEDPWLDAQVWPAIREANVANTIVRAGKLSASDVFEHLAAADVHINPSLCESLNMVTVEAAAVGTPTITSDGAGIAHWVSAYRAGMVVPAGESGRFADAIIFAFQNMAELAAWAAASRAMASEFTLDQVAAGLLSMMSGEPARTPGLKPA